MSAVKGLRHTAREYVLRVLYGNDLLAAVGEERPLPPIANWWKPDDRLFLIQSAEKFAREILHKLNQEKERIDQLIIERSKNWRLERMTLIDRNILRLAVCEILYFPSTPARVILNEAIEMAKCYGDENSTKFVNGILDPLARELREKHQKDE